MAAATSPDTPERGTETTTPEEGTTTPGRRERKKLATRDALRAAALELFAERSFDDVTVEEICTLADVASSTFFRHFATKEDVVIARILDRFAMLIAAFDAQPPDVTPAELLSGAMSFWYRGLASVETRRVEFELLASEKRLQDHLLILMVDWEQPLADLLARRFGFAPSALEPQLAAALLITTSRVVSEQWIQQPDADLMELSGNAAGPVREIFERLLTSSTAPATAPLP